MDRRKAIDKFLCNGFVKGFREMLQSRYDHMNSQSALSIYRPDDFLMSKIVIIYGMIGFSKKLVAR